MESTTLAVRPARVGDHGTRTRTTALIAALLLVLGMFVLVQQVGAPPAGAAVAATATVAGVDHAQINFSQLICSILISVRNAFASTPFGGFVTPILNALLDAFDCAPS